MLIICFHSITFLIVTATKIKQVLNLLVDGHTVYPAIGTDASPNADTNHPLFVGGVPRMYYWLGKFYVY